MTHDSKLKTRLNVFIAQASGMSRRAADQAIEQGRVTVNDAVASFGLQVSLEDTVRLDSHAITPSVKTLTIMLNKPVGYVCSRDGQGSKTVYDLLPNELHHLKPVGRLDKNSSGLLLLSNDGQLSQQLTHPSHQKVKEYLVTINKSLEPLHQQMINDFGITLEDGPSKLHLSPEDDLRLLWHVTMREGRNRQIRRTFEALGYNVTKLHRSVFGSYRLNDLVSGKFIIV